MNSHFTSFTPKAMRAFGEELAEGFQRRVEFLKTTRNHTFAMLAAFRKEHASAEAQRRDSAAREADARRLSMSELKSGVHSLLGRFELSRKEMAGDLQEMARELHAACDVFEHRPGHQDDLSGHKFTGPQPQPQPQPRPQPSSASPQPFRPATDTQNASAPPFRADAESPDANAPPFRADAEHQDGPKPRSGPEDKPGDPKKRHP
jgi:hypothetical protein